MKVLERKPWAHEFSSKLEAEREDVLFWEGCDMGGDYDSGYYVKCVVCGDDHTLTASKIPQDIRNEAQARCRKGK